MGDMKERARAWYERAFYSDDTRSQCIDSLTTLLAEVRSERLPCGHLIAEVQGEDGGTRWCAGCESEAGIRAETEARVVEAAAQVALTYHENLSFGAEITAESASIDTCIAIEMAIHAIAPADYVAVRREDFGVLAEAAEELEARIRMERAGYESSRADEIRAALSRARKGD